MTKKNLFPFKQKEKKYDESWLDMMEKETAVVLNGFKLFMLQQKLKPILLASSLSIATFIFITSYHS